MKQVTIKQQSTLHYLLGTLVDLSEPLYKKPLSNDEQYRRSHVLCQHSFFAYQPNTSSGDRKFGHENALVSLDLVKASQNF